MALTNPATPSRLAESMAMFAAADSEESISK
jgi:hypothetical protein